MTFFISPHDDDHALFGAFTCLRERPVLVVVFDSYVQEQRGLLVTAEYRASETAKAAALLGCHRVIRLGFSDADDHVRPGDIRAAFISQASALSGPAPVFAPAWHALGHRQHNLVAEAFGMSSPAPRPDAPVTAYYATYTSAGKVTTDRPVPIRDGSWIGAKLRALACYDSQHSLDPRMGCWPHFLREQNEYYI